MQAADGPLKSALFGGWMDVTDVVAAAEATSKPAIHPYHQLKMQHPLAPGPAFCAVQQKTPLCS